MAQQTLHRGTDTLIVGNEDAPRTVLLFHGYTGSPGDFGFLPDRIAERMDAQVIVPLLPGHGTKVTDLLPLTFDVFLQSMRMHLQRVVEAGRPYVIGGHSFGAYLAMIAAAESNPVSLFTTMIPFKLRFPFRAPVGTILSQMKPLWRKHLPDDLRERRSAFFFYDEMPRNGLLLLAESKWYLCTCSSRITCPVLTIHTHNDDLAFGKSGILSLARTKSEQREHVFVKSAHSIFFDGAEQEATQRILDFLSKTLLQQA